MEAFHVTLDGDDQQLITGYGCVTYWSVRDTTVSSGSVFEIYDGNSDDSQLILSVSTSFGESTSEFIGPRSVPFERGLFFYVISGVLVGAVSGLWTLSKAEWNAFLVSAS